MAFTLPSSVRVLDVKFQTVWLRAWNDTWKRHLDLDDTPRNGLASKTAWTVVNQAMGQAALIKQAQTPVQLQGFIPLRTAWILALKAKGARRLNGVEVEARLRSAMSQTEGATRARLNRMWADLQAGLKEGVLKDQVEAGVLDQSVLGKITDELEAIRDDIQPRMAVMADAGAGAMVEGLEAAGVVSPYAAAEAAIGEAVTTQAATLSGQLANAEFASIEAGIRHFTVENPVNPRTAARRIRSAVGLTGRDQAAAWKLQAALESQVGGKRAEAQVARYIRTLRKRRSETIARTEMARAFNVGSLSMVQTAKTEGGLDKHVEKTWLTAEDELVCDRCRPLNGKAVQLGDDFDDKVGGELARTPPVHQNCRCTMIFVTR